MQPKNRKRVMMNDKLGSYLADRSMCHRSDGVLERWVKDCSELATLSWSHHMCTHQYLEIASYGLLQKAQIPSHSRRSHFEM